MPRDERPKLSRRAWITTTSGVIAAGLVKTQADAIHLGAQEAPIDPTKVPGRLVSELGSRAPAEEPKRPTYHHPPCLQCQRKRRSRQTLRCP